jgi:hypothetical protein
MAHHAQHAHRLVSDTHSGAVRHAREGHEMKRHLSGGGRLLPAALGFLLVAAACGTSVATPTPAGTAPTSTVTATSTSAGTAVAATTAPVGATATATAAAATAVAATMTATTAAGGTATATAAAAGSLRRSAWVPGQAIKYFALVGVGRGWVWTERGIYQTLDDGATWANATPGLGTSHVLIVSKVRGLAASDTNHALLVVADVQPAVTTIYIWRTSDGGATWSYTALPDFRRMTYASECGSDLQCTGLPGDPSVAIDDVSPSVAFLSLYFRVGPGDTIGSSVFQYRTTDGGGTWTRLHFTSPLDVYADTDPQPTFSSDTTGVVVSGGDLYSTHTGWGSWTQRRIFDIESTTSNPWQEMRPGLVDSSHWYLSGNISATGTLTYAFSGDQGGTWAIRTTAIPGVSGATDVHVQFIDQSNWVATVATVSGSTTTLRTFRTGTGGASWSSGGTLPGPTTQARWANLVRGWAWGGSVYDPTRIYVTQDLGATWHSITG